MASLLNLPPQNYTITWDYNKKCGRLFQRQMALPHGGWRILLSLFWGTSLFCMQVLMVTRGVRLQN